MRSCCLDQLRPTSRKCLWLETSFETVYSLQLLLVWLQAAVGPQGNKDIPGATNQWWPGAHGGPMQGARVVLNASDASNLSDFTEFWNIYKSCKPCRNKFWNDQLFMMQFMQLMQSRASDATGANELLDFLALVGTVLPEAPVWISEGRLEDDRLQPHPRSWRYTVSQAGPRL